MGDPDPAQPERTVVIADDHPVFRQGLRALLSSTNGVRVVGEASTGEAAVTSAVRDAPDVVVMDLHMGARMNGVEATRQITQRAPGVHVLVITMFEDDESVFAAVRAGARGYVLKDADHEAVVHAVMAVAAGGAVFGPSVADRVQRLLTTGEGAATPFPQLTPRESQVLDLLAAGLDNGTIARRLQVAPKTVRNAVSTIFMKLQVADRPQAIVRARDAGLGRG